MASLYKFYKKHIKGTPEKAVVIDFCVHLCSLTNAVAKAINFGAKKVHIKGKAVKHLYDKKPAEEFESVLRHLDQIVKYPDKIYKIHDPKRGDFLFVKVVDEQQYLCSIEITDDEDPEDGTIGTNYVVTCFRLRKGKESYLNSYDLLWDWKGDEPSS